jgi:hypothetical protein
MKCKLKHLRFTYYGQCSNVCMLAHAVTTTVCIPVCMLMTVCSIEYALLKHIIVHA